MRGGVKEAILTYRVLQRNGETTLIRVKLQTGRTHQIRAHLAHIGCPVVGDMKYGDTTKNKEENATRQRLVSKYLRFDFEGEFAYLNDKTWQSQFDA